MIRIEFFRDKEKMGYQCILRNIMNMVNIMSINCFTVFSMFTKIVCMINFLGMLRKVSLKLIKLQMENIPAWNLHMDQIV